MPQHKVLQRCQQFAQRRSLHACSSTVACYLMPSCNGHSASKLLAYPCCPEECLCSGPAAELQSQQPWVASLKGGSLRACECARTSESALDSIIKTFQATIPQYHNKHCMRVLEESDTA